MEIINEMILMLRGPWDKRVEVKIQIKLNCNILKRTMLTQNVKILYSS